MRRPPKFGVTYLPLDFTFAKKMSYQVEDNSKFFGLLRKAVLYPRTQIQAKKGWFLLLFFAELALLMPFGIIFRLDIQLKHNLDPLIENKIK